MPAIASLEEFKAPQKDLYAMFYALCAMLFAVYRLWLEERTPEQLKGEVE